jgi:hypothetical protein
MFINPPRIGYVDARRPPRWVRAACCAAGLHYQPVGRVPDPAAVWEACGDCGKPVKGPRHGKRRAR